MQSSVNSATVVQKANTFTSHSLAEKPKVTINLMDVSFLEQNLSQILEVRTLSLKINNRLCKATITQPFCVKTGGI